MVHNKMVHNLVHKMKQIPQRGAFWNALMLVIEMGILICNRLN